MALVCRSIRRRIMHRDGRRCQICASSSNLTIDHVIPRSLGGSNHDHNLQVLCLKCNQKKSNKVYGFRPNRLTSKQILGRIIGEVHNKCDQILSVCKSELNEVFRDMDLKIRRYEKKIKDNK